MKTRILIFAAAVAALAASCQKIDVQYPVTTATESLVITAGVETKTSLAEDGKNVNWAADDVIAVFDIENSKRAFVTEDANVSGSSATFTGVVAQGTEQFYAVYPYNLANSANEGTLSVTVPANQTPKVGSFAEEHNISVAKAVRQLGNNSHVTGVEFKNVCALLKFSIPQSIGDVTNVTIEGDKAIAGNMVVSFDDNGVAVPVVDQSGSKSISMQGEFKAGSTFYFVLAPTRLNKLTVSVTDVDGNVYSMTRKWTADKDKDQTVVLVQGTCKNLGEVTFKEATVEAIHTSTNGLLDGTQLAITLPDATTSMTLKVQKGGVDVTGWDNITQLNNGVFAKPEAYPYLPQGSYTLIGSYVLNGKQVTFSKPFTVPAPTFTVTTPDAYTTYDVAYNGKGAVDGKTQIEVANGLNAETIYGLSGGSVSISNTILANSKYGNIIGAFTTKVGETSVNANTLGNLNWGNHTVTSSYTFDGVTKSSSKTCIITGLPQRGLPNTTLWQQTNYAAEVDWTGNNTNSYVKLEGFVGSASGIRTKNVFFAPNGGEIDATVNIDVNFLSIEYGWFNKRYYKAKLTCKIGDNTFISTEPGNATQYPFNTSSEISISNGNKMLIQCECWTTGPNISIYYVDILYR